MLQKRSVLSDNEVSKAGFKVFSLLKDTKILNFKNILVYADFKNEVATRQIIKFLLDNKRGVFLPKCDTETQMFEAVQIERVDYNSVINKYGIDEPLEKRISTNKSKNLIDCALVPGIAFDKFGNRIGFGCGYYDKFLKSNPDIYKIGLCYEFQIVDSIRTDSFDIPMDMLITEKRVFYCNRE